MRLTIVFGMLILVSCAKTRKEAKEEIIVGAQKKDTIYAGSYFKQEAFKSKKLSVIVDNGIEKRPVELKHGHRSIIRFTIERFEKYPLLVQNVKGGQIQRFDTSINTFEVYPTDSLLSFELHQDYAKGKVVLLHREWTDTNNKTYKDKIIAQDGSYRIAPLMFPVVYDKNK